ncbi:MAG: aminotransferase class I/II-fold pyridoxal phosphate-dependent enzyme, partial [Dissulfurispiraceae bacterium]
MFSEKLKTLEKEALLRHIKDRKAEKMPRCGLSHKGLSHLNFEDRMYINFASNDYLGLAYAASLIDAAANAMAEYGFGSGASRLLSGGTQVHSSLEKAVASFKETEAALVFNSGYTANISALPSIAGEGDAIFSDEFNHASLVDGCRLSRARKLIYNHRDIAHLEGLMKTIRGGKKIVVTDTVFSMDGDIAPLREITALCREHSALLYLDDAHGTGVLGNGRGALANFGIQAEPWIIQMGTFSKALGSYGAFIAGSSGMVEWLINTARG